MKRLIRIFVLLLLSGALMGASRMPFAFWKTTATPSGPTVITANVAASLGPTSGTTVTQAVDATGANFLVVHYGLVGAGGTLTGISATYNGVAMTNQYNYDPFAGIVYEGCFTLLSPASGSHNVVITITGDTLAGGFIGATPMSGVNGTTPTGTGVSADDLTGTSGTASVTCTSGTGELVLALVNMDANQPITNGAGQTTVWSLTDVTSPHVFRVTSQSGTASTTSSWTFSASAWIAHNQSIKP